MFHSWIDSLFCVLWKNVIYSCVMDRHESQPIMTEFPFFVWTIPLTILRLLYSSRNISAKSTFGQDPRSGNKVNIFEYEFRQFPSNYSTMKWSEPSFYILSAFKQCIRFESAPPPPPDILREPSPTKLMHKWTLTENSPKFYEDIWNPNLRAIKVSPGIPTLSPTHF